MKYYKNPIPIKENQVIHPCENCTEKCTYKKYGKDNLGEYIEIISCMESCKKLCDFSNDFKIKVYSEYIDEIQMKKYLRQKGILHIDC
jgi:hypothetical protein